MQKKLQHRQRVNSRSNVVHYDSGPLGQSLQLPDGRWLHDIEPSKKYKSGQHGFPRYRSE